MKKLTQLTVRPQEGRSFLLHVEDEEGRALDLAVSPEQMDVIAEAFDTALAENEDAAFAVDREADDDGQIYQKPLG